MKHEITMPVLSDTMQTGRLTRWNKAVGEAVKKGDALAEVETDKAILDVEAFQDGYLAGPLAPVDTDIPVRSAIAWLVDSKEELDASTDAQDAAPAVPQAPVAPPKPQQAAERTAPAPKTPAQQSVQKENPPPTVPSHSSPLPASPTLADGARASPYARGLAQELGIDLRSLGSGPIDSRAVLAAALRGPLPDLTAGPSYQMERLPGMRAAAARNMQDAVYTPTFQITARLPLAALQARAKASKQSLTLALARACALTVAEDPWFNHLWTPQGLAKRERVDVAIAVDTGDALLTPVLRDAARRPVKELAEDWRILLGKIKRGRLAPEDYRGGTFYLSNLGVFDVVHNFDAIVPLGAAAILAIAATQADGNSEFTLSCDHRVIFGADAARFLQRLRDRVADPSWLDS
ncbi:dihydrolipoamide acetyltransferase family protein [Acidithiobacillus sp. IBUN Pt1247-S3]|uniref:dihydrolipoamide acetyltransferase family protein n=1 Tax=Acidithiobacillus sp. IBUN Pt1247-S3 TaxID=3166642 RepID=UPI0034E46106